MNKYNIVEIDNLDMDELTVYTKLLENQIKHIYEPEPGLFIAESPVVIERALTAGYVAESVLTDYDHLEEVKRILDVQAVAGQSQQDVRAAADQASGAQLVLSLAPVPVYVAHTEVLSRLKGFEMTRGALCACRRKVLPTLEEICRDRTSVAVMEEVQNPTNVGAIFRSAAAMGIEAVVLTSGSADPLYRRAVRVSMGNVFLVPWTIAPEEQNVIVELKSLGFTTLAMALKDDTLRIDDPILKEQEKLAIVLGTESEGLKDSTIEACDYTVKIPMADGVDSLNVAAASAVAFWELGQI